MDLCQKQRLIVDSLTEYLLLIETRFTSQEKPLLVKRADNTSYTLNGEVTVVDILADRALVINCRDIVSFKTFSFNTDELTRTLVESYRTLFVERQDLLEYEKFFFQTYIDSTTLTDIFNFRDRVRPNYDIPVSLFEEAGASAVDIMLATYFKFESTTKLDDSKFTSEIIEIIGADDRVLRADSKLAKLESLSQDTKNITPRELYMNLFGKMTKTDDIMRMLAS